MSRRFIGTVALLVFTLGCASNTEKAVNELLEQVRLDDPQANVTYQDNAEVVESPEALPLWINALENEESPQVRLWAARLLGRIGDPQAATALTAALNGPRAVRKAAAAALLQIGEEYAEDAFIAALQSGPRETHIECLVQLEKMHSSKALPTITKVAHSQEPLVAESAVNALGGIGDPAAVEPLIALATDQTLRMQVRHAAIINLGRLSGPEATAGLEQVVQELKQQDGADTLLGLAQQTLKKSG
ncbi:MAG: HEAT repeat domain-containing protein [Acidobacteriota bacterium]